MNIKQTDQKYIAGTYARFDLLLTSGKGSLAFDETGKGYIDLGAGIGVNAFGYCDEVWQQAVAKQACMLNHTSNLYYTAPCAELAEVLCERTGMKKVFFGNSGAEANECAIKVARKYASDKYGEETEKKGILTLKNSFHGRTLATLAATGQDGYHKFFGPFPEGFYYVEAEDEAALEGYLKSGKICGFLMEMVQGEGGVIPLSESYVKKAAALAEQDDVLLMVAEVQTGNGRCGTLYAYQGYGIVPDVVTTAKGLGGGLPIGACLMGEKAKDTLVPGSHGSTFGGNPICAAGALTIINRIDEALLLEIREKGDYIEKALLGAKGVKSVTGKGLMRGILPERPVADVVKDCIARGVLVLTAKNKIRLLPALNIPFEQLKAAIEILKDVLAAE